MHSPSNRRRRRRRLCTYLLIENQPNKCFHCSIRATISIISSICNQQLNGYLDKECSSDKFSNNTEKKKKPSQFTISDTIP